MKSLNFFEFANTTDRFLTRDRRDLAAATTLSLLPLHGSSYPRRSRNAAGKSAAETSANGPNNAALQKWQGSDSPIRERARAVRGCEPRNYDCDSTKRSTNTYPILWCFWRAKTLLVIQRRPHAQRSLLHASASQELVNVSDRLQNVWL